MEGKTGKMRDFALIGHGSQSRTIRTEEWSYHMFLSGNKPSELYNIKKDWWEQHNIVKDNKDISENLEDKLKEAIENLSGAS